MAIDVDKSMRECVDRAAIADVLYDYACFVDNRNFGAVADLFTQDCLVEYGVRNGDTLCSPAEVVAWIRSQLHGVVATSHHISNVRISFIDADHAASTCYLYAWHHVRSGGKDPTVLGRYVDDFERGPGGWRILHRRLLAHGTNAFPPGILRTLPSRGSGEPPE